MSTLPAELIAFLDRQPQPHILLDADYRILAANPAYREAYGGATLVGRRCHEVSHHSPVPCDQAGESCPLARARDSGRTEQVLHVHYTPRGEEHVAVSLTPLPAAGDEAGEARSQYFVERMESLPVASANVAPDVAVGRAPAFLQALELVRRVAPSESSVLLLGETGTGKEVMARAVHEASRRAHAPFVAVDCSSLTETLFESELFGHERGAFTGATGRKLGLVEAASGGTLFLDELGDIALPQQVKLLRLLESGTYRRVGGVEPLRADIRLVAATHRDLPALIATGRFRADLYYRVSVFPIVLPPLRARREDLPLLAASLLQRLAPRRRLRLSAEALAVLEAYEFPGNIRELRNLLERATLLCDASLIQPQHFGLCATHTAPALPAPDANDPADRDDDTLAQALAEHHGDRRALARSLGVSERTLYRRLARLRAARG